MGLIISENASRWRTTSRVLPRLQHLGGRYEARFIRSSSSRFSSDVGTTSGIGGFGIVNCRCLEKHELRSQGSGDGHGYAYYSKGGHFLILTVAQDRKKNEKADPTDSERIELFKSMFRWGGTYKTEGNKVVYNVNIAWVPSWVGTTRTYQVETTSNKLTVTTPPFKSVSAGQALLSSRLRRGKRFREGICKILIDSLFISTVALCTLRLAGTRGRSIGNVAIGNVANDVVESCEAIIAETNIPKSPRSTPSRQLKN